MRELLEPAMPAGQNREIVKVAIAIGPEGGWTGAEFIVAAEYGFSEASLGVNILRTETAVCAALAAAQYALGAFRQTVGPPVSSPDGVADELDTAVTKVINGSRESSNE